MSWATGYCTVVDARHILSQVDGRVGGWVGGGGGVIETPCTPGLVYTVTRPKLSHCCPFTAPQYDWYQGQTLSLSSFCTLLEIDNISLDF
jgi:hypothetical protein